LAAALLIVTSVPDVETARKIAAALLDARLAACVQVGAAVESLYHWRGKRETCLEVPVTIKARVGAFESVAAEIRRLHPYELPEIVAVPIIDGSPDYLAWIRDETRDG
jgi:periplasmic divalent cation tolerance protein